MDETTRSRIRALFLSPQASFPLATAAELLGLGVPDLRREIDSGAIVAVSSPLGERVTRQEVIAAAMRAWEQPLIEEALAAEAASVLPEAIRLVDLRERVPLYQRAVLHALALREGTSLGEILRRELEDVVCAHASEVPEEAAGMG
jgi:hypothetical protein